MIELEVKAPCRDLAGLEGRLRAMGARRIEELEQVDVYYSHPARNFAASDEALRLRRENARSMITYKGPKLDRDTKMREEVELEVEDLERMALLLERVGFRPVRRVAKRRTVYAVGLVHICLDRVEGLGDFVEMEYTGDDLDAGKGKILELKQALGLEGNERRSYLELLMEKG